MNPGIIKGTADHGPGSRAFPRPERFLLSGVRRCPGAGQADENRRGVLPYMSIATVLVFVGLMILAFLLSLWRMRRALEAVVRIFREEEALEEETAKNLEELGLTPQSFIERLYRVRDYRPYALQLLQGQEVVQETPEGRLYLSQEKLAQSRFHELA